MSRPPLCVDLRKWFLRLAVSFALCACSLGLAQEVKIPPTGPTEGNPSKIHGLEAGVRAGYGFGLINPEGYTDPEGYNDHLYRINNLIPFWADLGYRIYPNWYVGAFFQFGIARGMEGCKGYTAPQQIPKCSGDDLRFGLNVHYHVAPDRGLDPWIGIGAGYEITHWKMTFPSDTFSGEFSGVEFVNLQLGVDYRVWRAFAVGPFLTFTLAQYSNQFAEFIGYHGLHGWLILGVRGVFNLIVD